MKSWSAWVWHKSARPPNESHPFPLPFHSYHNTTSPGLRIVWVGPGFAVGLGGDAVSAHWAVPGAKCVCVDGAIPVDKRYRSIVQWIIGLFARVPAKGEICLIRDVVREGGSLWLDLDGYEGWLFEVQHFRPLITKTQEQDVQMILSLLAPDEVPA